LKTKPAKKSKPSSKSKGRPAKYNPDIHIVLVEAMAQIGLTEFEIASKLRISERTLNRWKVAYPDFRHAIKSGKIEPDEIVKRSLYQRAVGYYFPAVKIFKVKGEPPCIVRYMEHVPPDVAAAFIWLKNRDSKNWKDRHEHTGEGGNPIDVNLNLDPELQSLLNTIIGRVANAA